MEVVAAGPEVVGGPDEPALVVEDLVLAPAEREVGVDLEQVEEVGEDHELELVPGGMSV